MKFRVLTLFPDLFNNWLHQGLVGQAYDKGCFGFEVINPRDFASGVHQSVDDKVYGGGDGMAQSYEPWSKAIEKAKKANENSKTVFLTPQGKTWNQELAREWVKEDKSINLVCGRYAGFDERLVYNFADIEISIGDYILNGGELPAMIVMETLVRGLPEVLGHESSFNEDSYGESGLLECPAFTRPQKIGGLEVPQFLLSGHHEKIEAYRRAVSIVRTQLRRPDLILKSKVSKKELEEAHEVLSSLSEEERDLLGVKI